MTKRLFAMFILAFLVISIIAIGIPFLIIQFTASLSYDIREFKFIGIIPIILSIYMGIRSIRDFVSYGDGTPSPTNPPKTLVAKGIYRIIRNPMYLAVFLFILGEAIVFQSYTLIAYFMLVWLVFHLFVVYAEEPDLRKRFGKSYEDYFKEIPRWLPKIGLGKSKT